jgi:FAD/FMN-containing dehydrogenase
VSLLAAGTAVALLRPALHLVRAVRNSAGTPAELPEGFVDDASRLNSTRIQRVWEIPGEPEAGETQLAALLAAARREHTPVSVAGARHSMGGQTIAPGGILVDMRRFDRMELDAPRSLLHVQAGARWDAIIPYLDRHGFSVGVMQSDNSFSVGGSISVNCHGWQFDRPPIASSVESFRMMKADGTTVRCSRDENAELFSLVLGGYGLFGIILDVELRVVPNARYRMEQYRVPAAEALENYARHVQNRSGVEMVYARLNIVPQTLFKDVLLTVFLREEGEVPPLQGPDLASLQRLIFRGSADSDYGKKVRWMAETRVQSLRAPHVVSRNSLLNQSADILKNRTPHSTDILHEYFIPPARVPEFVAAARRIIADSGCDLLNVTVRSVNEDTDSFLRYADQTMMAFVMLFQQPLHDASAEERSLSLTRALVDAALSCAGRYYLPYRLHASKEQFFKAYPQASRFFERKRAYDPEELFQNHFYQRYAAP